MITDRIDVALQQHYPLEPLCAEVLEGIYVSPPVSDPEADPELAFMAWQALVGHTWACSACRLRAAGYAGLN